MKYALSYVIVFFFFLISMFSLACKKIDFKKKKIYISYFFSLILLIFIFEFCSPALKGFLYMIVYIFLARLLITENLKQSILLSMTVNTLLMLAELIYGVLAYPLLNQEVFMNDEVRDVLINNFIIGIILFIFCRCKFFKKIYKTLLSVTEKIKESQIIIFSLFIITTFNFICWISYFVFKDLLNHYYLMFISSSLSLFSILLVFYYFKTQGKYLTIYEKYNVSLESIRQFELLSQKYFIETHEVKNQFRTIRSMSRNKKINTYIDALLNENTNDDEQLFSCVSKIPNGGLRGIIYTKSLLMKQKEILFELNVDKKITNDIVQKIDDYTLTSICKILGVFLDNAIDGVTHLSEQYIMVELYVDDNYVVVDITNNYEGFVDIEQFGIPGKTTKGIGRGYGLVLVQDLVSKNDKLIHNSEINENNFVQRLKIKV